MVRPRPPTFYTDDMRLSEARLCLDCDEVHADLRCPMCASESFAFIKRWVATSEKRSRPASPPATNEDHAETLATYRALLAPNDQPRSAVGRLLRGGAVGLALVGAAGWLLQRNLQHKDSATRPSSPPGSGSPDGPARS